MWAGVFAWTHYGLIRSVCGYDCGTRGPAIDSFRVGRGFEELLIRRIRTQYLAARGARDDETRGQVNPFIGESGAIRDLERQAGLALKTDSPILIEGETGSGKGALASWVHRH